MTVTRERIAALLLALTLVAVPAALWWYQQVRLPALAGEGVKVFDLTGVAANGAWTVEEVRGINYWWKGFQPATLFLRQGDRVLLRLRSADMMHQFYVPELGIGPVAVTAGHMETVSFTADRPGLFQYYCLSLCGNCHFYMRGWIVVTPPGEAPVVPEAIACPLEGKGFSPPEEPVALGEYLYNRRSCVSCHGPGGRGGVPNINYLQGTVPRHDTTAEKFFLQDEEDADAFAALLAEGADLEALLSSPPFPNYPLVLTRYRMAVDLIRRGKPSAKLDPAGPEPPLVMPAWGAILSPREQDALLSYFLALQEWEEDEGDEEE